MFDLGIQVFARWLGGGGAFDVSLSVCQNILISTTEIDDVAILLTNSCVNDDNVDPTLNIR